MRLTATLVATSLLAAGCAVETDTGALSLVTVPDNVDVLFTGGTPMSLTVAGARLYWIDAAAGQLVRMPTAGSATPTVLANGAAATLSPWSIAVDATQVYWIDTNDHAIRKTPRTGGFTQTLAINEGDCYGIVVDASYVYWSSNTGNGSRLRRVSRWGGFPVTIATGSYFTALAVDALYVYAADSSALGGANQIVRVPRFGGAKVVLASDEDAVGFELTGGALYWKRFWTGDVRRRGTALNAPTTSIATDGGGWGDLAVDATQVWWSTGPIVHRVPHAGDTGVVVAELWSWANSLALDAGDAYAALDPDVDVDGTTITPGAIVRVTP